MMCRASSATTSRFSWGSHTAFAQLEKAMLTYLDKRNRDPKPFVWTVDADLILGKVERLCQRMSNSGH